MVKRKTSKNAFYAKRQAIHQKIAAERIGILFSEAKKAFHENPERSERYVRMAREIGMKCNVSIPKKLRLMFCRKCRGYLVPGDTSSVRLDPAKGNIIITCKKCGNVKRQPYKKARPKV